MDSDVVHPGEIQRVKLEVLEPILRELIAFSGANLDRDRGELACLVQHTYLKACYHLQRIWRGHVARMRAKELGEYFHFIAKFSAALEIQRHCRGTIARGE